MNEGPCFNIIPTLETSRLRLRGHTYADLDHCVAMWAEPEVSRFIGGKPSTKQQTWTRLLAYVGHWAVMGFGYWAIEEKSSGVLVGEIGFADFKRDVSAEMQGKPELGFALRSAFHRKGYASEAVRAVLSWGDSHLTSRKTVCLIDAQNSVSLHVVEKFGYAVFDESVFNDRQTYLLARNAIALGTA